MLRPLLFSPAAVWLARALQEAGVERFLLLTDGASADDAAACFPPERTQVCTQQGPARAEAVRAFAAGQAGDVLAVLAPVWLSFSAAAASADVASAAAPDAAVGFAALRAADAVAEGGGDDA